MNGGKFLKDVVFVLKGAEFAKRVIESNLAVIGIFKSSVNENEFAFLTRRDWLSVDKKARRNGRLVVFDDVNFDTADNLASLRPAIEFGGNGVVPLEAGMKRGVYVAGGVK